MVLCPKVHQTQLLDVNQVVGNRFKRSDQTIHFTFIAAIRIMTKFLLAKFDSLSYYMANEASDCELGPPADTILSSNPLLNACDGVKPPKVI